MTSNSWITEALVQFSESPLWKTPVENFIDDNCCIFSTDSEMKLEYTIVHNKFRELIDSLLTSCVEELDVSMETAVEALRSTLHHHSQEYNARTQRHAAKKMLRQVFSADNFSSFYTMMVKRNLELDILANASLAARGINLTDAATYTSAEMLVENGEKPARAQRAIDANGDLGEEEALRRAIEASLQDPASQQQVQTYSEVCAQDDVNFQVQDAEHEAQHQKVQLEAALQGQPGTPEVEQYRQEHLQLIDDRKNSQIQQIQNHTLSGPKQSFYHDRRRPTAEFSAPEMPEVPTPTPEPVAVPAPDVVPAVLAPAATPAAPAASPVPQTGATGALPPIGGRQQGALPCIPGKPASVGGAGGAAGTASNASTVPAAPPHSLSTSGGGPDKAELEQRAQYMRQQRELILARNRASRQHQLKTYVQQTQPTAAGATSAAAASGEQKDLTVEIARRLRGDLVGEGRKAGN